MADQTKKEIRSIDGVLVQFLRIINKINRFDKVSLDYGIEEKLFPIEIHTIDAIGRYPGISVTKLAGLTGVTKGAVSQKIGLLEKKDLVRKTRNPENDKEIQLKLTQRGWQAFKGHQEFHQEMFQDIVDEMRDLTIQQLGLYGELMDKIEIHLNRYIEKYLG